MSLSRKASKMSKDEKRSNYEGSEPVKRKDGRWQVNVWLPGGGKRKSFYGKTPPQAKENARKAVSMVEAGQKLPNGRMTVGKFLAKWITGKQTSVRLKTWVRYEEIVRLHLIPDLGKVKLSDLKWQMLDEFYAS